MAVTIFDYIDKMPKGAFRELRMSLRSTSEFYSLTADPDDCTATGIEEMRQVFKTFGVPDEFLETKGDIENAIWAVMGRSVSVR